MIEWDEFRERVEALLTELDRRRLEQSDLHQGARRIDVPPPE